MSDFAHKYKIQSFASKVQRNLTMRQLIDKLEGLDVVVEGDPRKNSKREILIASLTNVSVKDSKAVMASFYDESVDRNQDNCDFKLHPEFKGTKVEKFLLTGDVDEAVRVALVRINNRVKKLSDLSLDGAPLMRKTFSRNNPILS